MQLRDVFASFASFGIRSPASARNSTAGARNSMGGARGSMGGGRMSAGGVHVQQQLQQAQEEGKVVVKPVLQEMDGFR